MATNDNELNHLIWFFSLTKKEKDMLNTLPNNIKGGLDWMSLRGGKFAEISTPVAKIVDAKETVKPVAKKRSKKATKGKKLVTVVKKGRGRPKKA